MTATLVLVYPAAIGLAVGAFLFWPVAHRRGFRAAQRDAAEVGRILGGFEGQAQEPARPDRYRGRRRVTGRQWRALLAHRMGQHRPAIRAVVAPRTAIAATAYPLIGRPPGMAHLRAHMAAVRP